MISFKILSVDNKIEILMKRYGSVTFISKILIKKTFIDLDFLSFTVHAFVCENMLFSDRVWAQFSISIFRHNISLLLFDFFNVIIMLNITGSIWLKLMPLQLVYLCAGEMVSCDIFLNMWLKYGNVTEIVLSYEN